MRKKQYFTELIIKRINHFLLEKNLSINQLALISFMPQSTLESIMNAKTANPQFLTILKICYGLNISLSEFFDDDIFDYIDFEHII